MTDKHSNLGAERLARLARAFACAASCILTILVIMPLNPTMPAAGLDSSWQYALNVATSNQLRFGTDLIFTFGPLASAYTQQYSPATDTLMLLVSFILGSAVFLGFAILIWPRRLAWLIAVPVVLTLFGTLDAVYMVLPLLFLLAAERSIDTRWVRPTVFFLGAACALLPLIKGSLVPGVGLATLLAAFALARRSWWDAALLVAVELGSMALAWTLVGQSLADLPVYFTAQSAIIAGYTEAMAINGRISEIVVYLALACLVLWAAWKPPVSESWRILLAIFAVLFLSFKLGFVRHDGHAVIAGATLTLIGCALFLRAPSARTFLPFAAAVGGWIFISSAYVTSGGPTMLSLAHSTSGLVTRVVRPERLEAEFWAGNKAIAKSNPLPRSSGTADLYPFDLSTLLANGAEWSPRPIFQSYSAYLPNLALANAEHLTNSGAQRVFFAVQPIDARYPSLDDGASWPILLSKYKPIGLAGEYATLDRGPGAEAGGGIGGPVFEGVQALGKQVAVPRGAPVWAEIDVKPTLLGRAASLLFKLPVLKMVVQYTDGTVGEYRFVPGSAKTGFLLSPTVSTARDFVAMRGEKTRQLLASRQVVSFGINGASGTRFLWSQNYSLRMSPISIQAAPAVDDLLFSDHEGTISLDGAAIGGDCHIDAINGVAPSTKIQLQGDLLLIRGWAMISGPRGEEHERVAVAVTNPGGETRVFRASQTARPDVAAHFGQLHAQRSGYEALIDASNLGPSFQLRVLQWAAGQKILCGQAAVAVTR